MGEIAAVQHAVHAEDHVRLKLPNQTIEITSSETNSAFLEEAKDLTKLKTEMVKGWLMELDGVV